MAQPKQRAFDHILILMFENQYRSYVMKNPYMRRLARQGIQLSNFFGIMHPSQTNYIASAAGALCNVSSDGVPPLSSERTLVDLLEESPTPLQWAAYMESYVPEATPWSPTFSPKDAPPYYIKHNPFASFASVVRNEARWKRIQNESALFSDLLNDTLPEYAWFTPNIWNDGHWLNGTKEESTPRAPQLVDQLAVWLESFFKKLRFPGPTSHLPPRTLVVVTFDESDFEEDYLPDQASAYDGPNQIYTVLLGDMVDPGEEEEGYNHYSLLRTIEVNFGLGHLNRNDAEANYFQFLWGRHFVWENAKTTPLQGTGPLAAGAFAGACFVAQAHEGGVQLHNLSQNKWSPPEWVAVDGTGGLALAATEHTLFLVARDAHSQLSILRYDLENGWSTAQSFGTADAFALTSFDKNRQLMLAIRQGTDVYTHLWQAGAFADAVAVPAAASDGALALGTLGASLYLMVKAPEQNTIHVISYNTADYNVVTVPPNPYGGPQDNTTVNTWAPCAFPVAHFSSSQPVARPYTAAGPLCTATLDGVLHLVHPGPANSQLLTETFSIAGLLTPSQPVSYRRSDSADHSNGFGTLAEAGWSKQKPLWGHHVHEEGALSLCRFGHQLLMFYRRQETGTVQMVTGHYSSSPTPKEPHA